MKVIHIFGQRIILNQQNIVLNMANARSLEAKVVRLARKLGYASAKYLKVWRGYDVYRAFDDESMADVESPMDGPTFILAKDGYLRYASLDETAVLQ